jgi:16S rRNA (adenine1518-N6/adenine1519-N6)-dimethyltransferase
VSNRRRHEAKKSLGQNFLVSRETAARIVEEARVGPEGLVFEIGPGRGALTLPLAGTGAHVVAFEIDRSLVDELRDRFRGSERMEILHRDIRGVELDGEAEERGYETFTLLGNIPYNLTSTILLELPGLNRCRAALLMIQREVGERVLAPPGVRECGILSVYMQSYMTIEKVLRVRPGSFNPRPRVESVVLRFTPKAAMEGPVERGEFLEFLKGAFSQRRKKLGSVFRDVFGMGDAGNLSRLGRVSGVSMDDRPENLSLGQWKRLFEAMRQGPGS